MKFSCKSVIGGWQTLIRFPDGSECLAGPVFNECGQLWQWQADNLSAHYAAVDVLRGIVDAASATGGVYLYGDVLIQARAVIKGMEHGA